MTDKTNQSSSSRVSKLMTTLTGGFILIVGIVLIPYPGPGWLIVLAGLTVLAREYPWARKYLNYTRSKYFEWEAWIKRQNWWIRSLTLIGTTIVVILTLYLLNMYGALAVWLNIDAPWVNSPLPFFN